MILSSQGQILDVEVNYEPSPYDLEELCYSLLYLRVLEQLKEVRDRLSLSQPSVEVIAPWAIERSDRISAIITMNDTDLLLEAATEYLLNGSKMKPLPTETKTEEIKVRITSSLRQQMDDLRGRIGRTSISDLVRDAIEYYLEQYFRREVLPHTDLMNDIFPAPLPPH